MTGLRVAMLMFVAVLLNGDKLHATEVHSGLSGSANHAVEEAEPPALSVSLEQIFFAVGAFVLLVLVAILAIAYCLQAQETQHSAQTSGHAYDWRERVLDTCTELNMWEAIGRGDGDALREELKLMELRQIRRQGQ